jgi:hypothetical protein|tara:strand:- start:1055 stop:2284 length:1230 start_codon:yes stop_codon:yes gene_type:complete
MGLWGKVTTADSRPKFLPVDSNAQGSSGSRQDAIAVSGGWALSPGHPNSGNDNKDAQPEVLVCIRNLAEVFGAATPVSIGWTEGEVADTGTFDITVTFDEAVDVTSAARSANQTVTNKAHILLSRLGATDMVEDSTVACQYFSGSGTNQIVFRGLVQTNAAAGFLAFNGGGVGDAASEGRTAILFNGTSDITEEDGGSILGLMLEEGTRDVPGDKLVMDSSAGTVMTVNGALSGSTTLVVDGVSGATLVVGQVITVKGGAASISDSSSDTRISTDNSLTITAVASQTSVTVSEAITVANDIVLLASTDGAEEIHMEGVDFTIAGSTGTADITDLTFTGGDSEVYIGLLEQGTGGDGEDKIILNGTDGDSANANEGIVAEDYTSDIAVYTQAGSTSGTASVLNGVTVAAS